MTHSYLWAELSAIRQRLVDLQNDSIKHPIDSDDKGRSDLKIDLQNVICCLGAMENKPY